MRRILAVLAGAASIVLAGAVHARAATGIVTPTPCTPSSA